jgi:cytochrome P450
MVEKEAAAAPSPQHATVIGNEFNPFDGPQLQDPYPFYARARREQPVFYSPLLKMWYVTRYDDIKAVLQDTTRFSSIDAINVPLEYTEETRRVMKTLFVSERTLVDNDPPAHTRIRRLVGKAFTARMGSMEARVRAIAHRLIDGFAGDGHAEFINQFAFPMPIRVILDMLGAPEDDMFLLKRWSEDWITHLTVQLTPEQQAENMGRLVESQRYWTAVLEERQARPRDDLLSDILRAAQEEGTSVSHLQLVNICSALVLGGHETTTKLLGHCLYRLLSQPEQWRLVLDDPANIPRAFEEALRADSSVQALTRTTTVPVEIGGVTLPKGAKVALLFGSANHDEAYFPDAARFDLRREDSKGHLAFSHGVHFCVGAPLARLEGRVALELLSQRLPGLRLAPNQRMTYLVDPIFRGLEALKVEWNG